MSAAEWTSLAIGPIWSKLMARSIKPYLGTRPYVGFKPTTPQCDAGFLMLPPVSLPSARSQKFAATAAALPEEEPPGILPKAAGLFVAPKQDVSPELPQANSSMFVIPIIIPSSPFILSTTVA